MAALARGLRTDPMGASGTRYRIAGTASAAFHAAVLVLIALLVRATPAPAPPEPIEVTLLAPKPAPAPPPPPPVVKVEVRPAVKAVQPRLAPGGNPKAPVRKNPSPVKSPRPANKPASNAGGKEKAAPGPPDILTSYAGQTPAGATGKGSAAAGPGGKEESPGGGPSYGPSAVGGPNPTYPKAALDQGLEGTVTLEVTVGADGKVTAVTVAESSGHASLDAAAVRAVKRGWNFTSAMEKGKAAAGKVTVIFEFKNGDAKRG
jgi:protein TonB